MLVTSRSEVPMQKVYLLVRTLCREAANEGDGVGEILGSTQDAGDVVVGSHGRRASLTLLAVCLGFFMILLDGSALNVALPSMQRDVGGSMSALQWLINIYTIPLASLLLTAGVLADRAGSRRVFVWSLAGFTLASLLCALSPTLAVLTAFRCLQGIAAAGVLPTTLAIIARNYPDPMERARAIMMWGATGSIALVVGPIGGGIATEVLGWRAIFLVNVPVGIVALGLSIRYADETDRRRGESFDFTGQILAILGLVLLVAGLIESGEHGWSSPLTLGLIGLSVPALVGFVLVELRVPAPMLPLDIFRRAAFSASIACGFAFQFGAYGLQFVVALNLQQHWAYSPLRAGMFMVPFATLWTLGTLVLNRRWAAKGMRWLMTTGGGIALIGAVGCLFVGGAETWPVLLIATAIVGLGAGILGPSCNGAAMAAIDRQFAGMASGVLNTSRQVGMAIGIACLGSLLATFGFEGGLRISAALVGIGFAAIIGLSARYLRDM